MNKNFFYIAVFLLFSGLLFAVPLTDADLLQAAQNWMASSPVFTRQYEAKELESVSEYAPLRLLTLSPKGYLVMSSDDGLPPVLAFSEQYDLPPLNQRGRGPFWALLRQQAARYIDILAQPATRSNADYLAKNQAAWTALLEKGQTRADPIEQPDGEIIQEPLINWPWHQDWPFNMFYLRSDKELPAVAGCEPLATAMLMRFHQWPPSGKGSKTWEFNGDPDYPQYDVLGHMYADFSRPYNWAAMSDSFEDISEDPGAPELAVGRLVFDLAVALESLFAVKGTATWDLNVVSGMKEYFHYAADLQKQRDLTKLFSLIKADLERGYPVHVSIEGHSFVASGLATHGGEDYYHLNYGWGGSASGWYKLDDGDEGSVVSEAITNFLPAQKAVFMELPQLQNDSFELSWDYPHIFADPERFRLTVKRGARTIEIANDINGDSRRFELTGQPEGAAEYYLEAWVDGIWQTKSEPLHITVQAAPVAAPPQFTLNPELQHPGVDGAVRIGLQLDATDDVVSFTSSRPDLFPTENIRLLGNGVDREILLLPASLPDSNSMLHVKVSNAAGQSSIKTAYIIRNRLVWHRSWEDATAQAEAEGKRIFLLVGNDNYSHTADVRLNVCAVSDIAYSLEKDFVLCHLTVAEASDKGLIFTQGFLPFSTILQYADDRWQDQDSRSGRLSPADLRVFLGLPPSPMLLIPELQYCSFHAQSVFLRILCRGDWELNSDADFVQAAQGSGSCILECVLDKNASSDVRSAVLTLNSAGREAQSKIEQSNGAIKVQLQAEDKEYDGSDAATIADLSLDIDGETYWVRNISGHFLINEPGEQREIRVDSYEFTHPELEPEFLPFYAEIRENSFNIPVGWNSVVLQLTPNDAGLQDWTENLQAYELQNRAWVKVNQPEAGKSYLIYNPGEEELCLKGKALFENIEPLPETPGWKLQGIIVETELPENMSAWYLEKGKYKLQLQNNLLPGRAYWLYRK